MIIPPTFRRATGGGSLQEILGYCRNDVVEAKLLLSCCSGNHARLSATELQMHLPHETDV